MLVEESCFKVEGSIVEKKEKEKEQEKGEEISTSKDCQCYSPSSSSKTNNKGELELLNNKQPKRVPKSKKSSCGISECLGRPIKIVGDCKYCMKKFCPCHRLPEDHKCPNLSEIKGRSLAILSEKVMNEKCVGDKVSDRF